MLAVRMEQFESEATSFSTQIGLSVGDSNFKISC